MCYFVIVDPKMMGENNALVGTSYPWSTIEAV